MANEPVNLHDAFFKQYLSIRDAAADFLRNHLPQTVLAQLDLTQLELVKDTFVDEQLRNHFSDLVYRTQTTAETPVAIALLFEHKSYPDEWVNFQIIRYAVNFWQQEYAQIQADYATTKTEAKKTGEEPPSKQRTLTPILPLLVYHGQREWKVSLRFARHLTGLEDPKSPLAQALDPYVPDFQPHFVNLTAMSDAEIQGEVVTRLFVLVLKHIFERGLGGHLDEILALAAEVIRQPNGMAMVVALLRYLGRAGIQLDKDEVAGKLAELLPTEGGILMQTMAEEWIAEGEIKGRRAGHQEGRQETLRAMVLRVLHRRFTTGEEQFQQIEQQLAQITDETVLNELVDAALDVLVLPDFVVRLQKVIPTDV
ncbi:MAG: Rpn family recombination-promoting nuclease/putative transposase [Caldilineaceae bacterium]|nr:Rpn family recombination-promoting nuclease/putative transposase [Caldilineaceae bacterium]